MKRLLYFTSPNCVPCRTFGPLLEQTLEELENSVSLAKKVGGDPMAQDDFNLHGVRAVPTIILFEDDEELNRSVGALSKKDLRDFLNG